MEGGGERPGHQHVAIGAPFDNQFPAVHLHAGATAHEAATGGIDQGGAGAGAAGQRQPGAALPHAQAESVGGEHLNEADVGALGKQGGVLQRGADPLDRHGGEVGHEEGGVRVAHRAGRGVRHRPLGQIEVQRVGGAGERDVAPVQSRRPHIHGDAAGLHFRQKIA